ncbi:MAG: MFS transporter, partial [Actinomycetota bacterium]
MMAGAAGGATVVVVLLVALRVPGLAASSVPYVVAYLLLAFAHTGSRLGRKTYVVDLGEGNARTDYVAVSNTAMGVLLLATGAVSAGLAMLGVEVALVFLAALGFAGVASARRLPEVSDASS